MRALAKTNLNPKQSTINPPNPKQPTINPLNYSYRKSVLLTIITSYCFLECIVTSTKKKKKKKDCIKQAITTLVYTDTNRPISCRAWHYTRPDRRWSNQIWSFHYTVNVKKTTGTYKVFYTLPKQTGGDRRIYMNEKMML